MKILYIGAVEFSRQCLDETLAAGGNVAGVFTLGAEHAGFHGDYADLAPVADAHGVPIHRIRDVNDPEALSIARSLEPDVIFVFGWSQLLGREFLTLAPCVGSHPALLPRDRGRHPITWALVDGLEESGLTFLWLDEGADTGDILWQRRFRIERDDDASSVYRKVCELGRAAVREFLPLLEAGKAPRTPQNHARASYRRRRTDEDRVIDWSAPSHAIHNLIRGLARPYVGAITRRAGHDVIVWRAKSCDERFAGEAQRVAPGTVLGHGSRIAVRTGDGWLELLEVDPAGALFPGDVLERAQ